MLVRKSSRVQKMPDVESRIPIPVVLFRVALVGGGNVKVKAA